MKSNKNNISSSSSHEHADADNENFESLMNFSAIETLPYDSVKSDEKITDVRKFSYTADDTRQFEKIMPTDHRAPTISRHKDKVLNASGYSNNDNSQFEALMAFDNGVLEAPWRSLAKPLPLSESLPHSVEYSEQDLLAFDKLSTDATISDGTIAAQVEEPVTNRDRDVGPIKIIDYDKLPGTQPRRNSHGNLKIKYFD
ncbi:MAG: hypothetical protein ACI8P9_002942 [Parasphingorhabdus sp.]|jgi:hypothetical protein